MVCLQSCCLAPAAAQCSPCQASTKAVRSYSHSYDQRQVQTKLSTAADLLQESRPVVDFIMISDITKQWHKKFKTDCSLSSAADSFSRISTTRCHTYGCVYVVLSMGNVPSCHAVIYCRDTNLQCLNKNPSCR